jgi:hypothetical protein
MGALGAVTGSKPMSKLRTWSPYLIYGNNNKSGCWEFTGNEEQECVDYRVLDVK